MPTKVCEVKKEGWKGERERKESGKKRESIDIKIKLTLTPSLCYLPGKMISLFSKDPLLPINTGANWPELFPVKLYNTCTYINGYIVYI